MGFLDKVQAKVMNAGRPQAPPPQARPAPVMPAAPAATGPPFSAPVFKQKLKIGKTRGKVQQSKAQNAAHVTRQAVIRELRANKNPSAYIKMEQYLRDTGVIESHDVLEAYVELLVVRVQVIEATPRFEDLPEDIQQAVASLVYASSRGSNTEFRDATAQLRSLYSSAVIDPITAASGPYAHHISEFLIRKLTGSPPDEYEVRDGLQNLAAEEGINWYCPPEPKHLLNPDRSTPQGTVHGFPAAQQQPYMYTNVPGPSAPSLSGPPAGPSHGTPAGPPGSMHDGMPPADSSDGFDDMPPSQPGSYYSGYGAPPGGTAPK